MNRSFIISLLIVSISNVKCFSSSRIDKHGIVRSPSWLHSISSLVIEDGDSETQIRSMRVKKIKEELHALGVNCEDVFEKEELIQRLLKSRKENRTNGPLVLEKNSEGSEKDESISGTSMSSTKERRIKMDFHTLAPHQSVEAKNDLNVFLRPSPGKFPSIRMHLPNRAGVLNLLVDTACSGVVLRPNIVKKFNLPTFNIGSTMQAAGGITSGAIVSKIMAPKLDDGTVLEDMMVAGQDIGALPISLDGIIGISFLRQFQCVAFDFQNGELVLKKTETRNEIPNLKDIQSETLAECNCSLSRLGIWTVDVMLDGRGPVKMLLDTGAASSFLNWKGAQDCNLNRDHPLVSRNRDAIGAMGADNKAFELSHRFQVKRRVNFKNSNVLEAFGPLGINITESGTLNIDIGDLPVLESLKSENVGGILGSDLLMRCDILELDFSKGKKYNAPRVRMIKRVAAVV